MRAPGGASRGQMRVPACAVVIAAILAVSPAVYAQSPAPTVNQRLTAPTSESDAYMGVSLGQLIMALGLTLKGAPPVGLDEIRVIRSRQTAEAPRAPSADNGARTPVAAPGIAPPSR